MAKPADYSGLVEEMGKNPGDHDPLDIKQANDTRKVMSQGQKTSINQLFFAGQRMRDKFSVLLRYLKCRFGPGKLTVEEFINFRLNRPDAAGADRFVGHAAQNDMHRACNDLSWFAATKHKLLWEMILTGAGLAVPRTMAVYEKSGRGAGVPVLQDKAALAQFLSQSSHIPVFCKPVTGVYSIGAFRIDGFDGQYALINGRWKKSVDDIAGFFEAIGKKGYLLQRPLAPHDRLLAITGNAIATLRFLLVMDGGTPNLMRCVLKVPAKGEVADNFWRPQAQLCAVDMASGNISTIITNTDGDNVSAATANSDKHLASGFAIPDFQAAKDLLVEAARHFPAIRTQSWDVAVTDDGPVLMELNFGGDLGLVQLAHGTGILTRQYCEHLRKSGYQGRLPG